MTTNTCPMALPRFWVSSSANSGTTAMNANSIVASITNIKAMASQSVVPAAIIASMGTAAAAIAQVPQRNGPIRSTNTTASSEPISSEIPSTRPTAPIAGIESPSLVANQSPFTAKMSIWASGCITQNTRTARVSRGFAGKRFTASPVVASSSSAEPREASGRVVPLVTAERARSGPVTRNAACQPYSWINQPMTGTPTRNAAAHVVSSRPPSRPRRSRATL